MKDDFEQITPENLGQWTGGITPAVRGKWRVTVWNNGRHVAHKDFVYESLANGWAEKIRYEYRKLKATGVFVKKENLN